MVKHYLFGVEWEKPKDTQTQSRHTLIFTLIEVRAVHQWILFTGSWQHAVNVSNVERRQYFYVHLLNVDYIIIKYKYCELRAKRNVKNIGSRKISDIWRSTFLHFQFINLSNVAEINNRQPNYTFGRVRVYEVQNVSNRQHKQKVSGAASTKNDRGAYCLSHDSRRMHRKI